MRYLYALGTVRQDEGNKTPEMIFYNKKNQKSFIGHLKVVGCTAYAHIPDENRHKLEQKSVKCIFVGYGYI